MSKKEGLNPKELGCAQMSESILISVSLVRMVTIRGVVVIVGAKNITRSAMEWMAPSSRPFARRYSAS